MNSALTSSVPENRLASVHTPQCRRLRGNCLLSSSILTIDVREREPITTRDSTD